MRTPLSTSSSYRELGCKDPRDLSLDTSGTRCFSTFLVELAQSVPAAVLPSISVLLPHLGGEVRCVGSYWSVLLFLTHTVSLSHALLFPLTPHSLTHSPTHLPTHSLTQTHTLTPTHSLTHSLSLTHSFPPSSSLPPSPLSSSLTQCVTEFWV